MKFFRIFVLVMLMFTCLQVAAGQITLSAQWNGAEELIAPFDGTCNGAGKLAYQVFNPIQVSEAGDYYFSDAADELPGDLVVAIYDGSFDPSDPKQNRVAIADQGVMLNVASGRDYTVVVQHFCSNTFPASFAVSLSGQGDITGADVVESQQWTLGSLSSANPKAKFSGVSQNYALSGPISVPVTGLYSYAEVSLFNRLDMVLRVYEGSFNPANTSSGLVVQHDDSGGLVLRAGTSYWFVVTAGTPANSGEWEWVLYPPGPLQINEGLDGNWYNPATSGQGILIDVMEDIQLMFAAWFTYDLQNNEDSDSMIGGDGHRWLTASGNYEDGDALISLEIQNTTGGVFDSADQVVLVESAYGNIEIEFKDCLNATLNYDIPAGPVSGVIPITRASYDHLALCAHLGSTGPGVITD